MKPQLVELPTELLLLIFHDILDASPTLEAYTTLRNCARVCKRWAPVATEVLLYWAEVPTPKAAARLEKRLRKLVPSAPGKSFIKALTYVTRTPDDSDQLGRLLALDSSVRHLILCGGFNRDDVYAGPSNLSNLQFLTDVSLLSSHETKYPPQFLRAFLPLLPASVRFLNLPQDHPNVIWDGDSQPAFKLYGLSVPFYPTEVTNWLLQRSRDSLQCLTLVFNPNLVTLAENHPNLRSLKILEAWPHLQRDFSIFERLERLELRWFIEMRRPYDSDLPDSLRYIRLWGTGKVEDLNELLADGRRLPNLRVVVWDQWFFDEREKVVGMRALERLRELCSNRAIELQTYLRERRLGHANIVDRDFTYETTLRRSCFEVPTALSQPVPSKLPTIIAENIRRRPLESRNGPLTATYYREAVFASRAAKHPGLLEDCFEGYVEWLEEPFDLPTVVTSWGPVERKHKARTILGWCRYIIAFPLRLCGSSR